MDKEFLVQQSSSITLNVTAGKVDSYRRRDETTGTVRVYQDGKIGVAGALGTPDEEALTRQAVAALAQGIPYPCQLDEALDLEELHEEEILPEKDFLPAMQALLERMNAAFPKFAFSNKLKLNHHWTEYRNSRGRHLVCSNRELSIGLLFQCRGSGNLFDGAFPYDGKCFDPDAMMARFQEQYDAYFRPVELPEGECPVLIDPGELFGTVLTQFMDQMYVSGASLLSGKLGQKIFSDKLSFMNDANPATAFHACCFDTEGQIAPDYRAPFIQNGVLTGVLTTKKSAAQFGLPAFKTSNANYDGVPSLGLTGFYVAPTAQEVKDLVPGRAIWAATLTGGDMTPDGHFASPVQLAYLMEDGKLAGRLPALNIGGDFFNLLGKDYLGAVERTSFQSDPLLAARFQVTRG